MERLKLALETAYELFQKLLLHEKAVSEKVCEEHGYDFD